MTILCCARCCQAERGEDWEVFHGAPLDRNDNSKAVFESEGMPFIIQIAFQSKRVWLEASTNLHASILQIYGCHGRTGSLRQCDSEPWRRHSRRASSSACCAAIWLGICLSKLTEKRRLTSCMLALNCPVTVMNRNRSVAQRCSVVGFEAIQVCAYWNSHCGLIALGTKRW